MKLRESLDEIESRYSLDLRQLDRFTSETHAQLLDRLQTPSLREELGKLTDDEREEFSANLRQTIERITSDPDGNFTIPPLVGKWLWATLSDHTTELHLGYLGEMALIYAVTLMEAFTKEYLLHLYTEYPNLIKSSKSITFEEALSFSTIVNLRQALAEREIEQVSYKNVDQLADYLNTKFNLGISEDLDWWGICREAVYRRNLVVHNRGVVNQIYTLKIKDAPEPGTELDVSTPYLHDVTEAIAEYVAFLHNSLVKKLDIQ